MKYILGVLSGYRPSFQRSALLVRNLAEASSLRAWVQQQLVDVSWLGPTQRDALVRLAHYSTRIEGNPLTLPEVEALAAGKDLQVEERAKREVLNYFAALRWIWRSSLKVIHEADLLKLHRLLTQDILSANEVGAYKAQPNAVFAGGQIIYRPPPPELCPELTKELLKWLNSSDSLNEHPVIAAAIAHHRFVSIHPFMDGNGRAARALESWILFRREFDTHHIFALDEFFDHDRQRYYREIQAVRDRGDELTSWLEYVSEAVIVTLQKTQQRIQTLRAKGSDTRITLNATQERILQALTHSPLLKGSDLARTLRISRALLSKAMRPLLDARLIVKEGSTKAAIYRLKTSG
ncbi:MAG: Fic family protein [Elusimicrobia bacterium]|nr:Fic family protein [Elusimicrobiota bacterium]